MRNRPRATEDAVSEGMAVDGGFRTHYRLTQPRHLGRVTPLRRAGSALLQSSADNMLLEHQVALCLLPHPNKGITKLGVGRDILGQCVVVPHPSD